MKSKEKYSHVVSVRYRTEDAKILQSKAEGMNINLGTYVRHISLKNSKNE